MLLYFITLKSKCSHTLAVQSKILSTIGANNQQGEQYLIYTYPERQYVINILSLVYHNVAKIFRSQLDTTLAVKSEIISIIGSNQPVGRAIPDLYLDVEGKTEKDVPSHTKRRHTSPREYFLNMVRHAANRCLATSTPVRDPVPLSISHSMHSFAPVLTKRNNQLGTDQKQ